MGIEIYKVIQIQEHDKCLYMCPHCKWVYFGKEYMEKHIKKDCFASPYAAGCSNCGWRKMNDDGDWVCGDGQVKGRLFGNGGKAITGCVRWHERSAGDDELCYYTEKLAVGSEIKPQGYYKTYRVVGIEEINEEK